MTAPNDTHVLLRAFCDELGRCGMTDACTSPGSRSAPLVLALAREPALRAWSHLDERCAGFFALGLAKESRRPVAVACTSGTAAAELSAAVQEAHHAHVPLLVLTADRPPELRDVGAGQAIDQLDLYGRAAKWFFEVGTHEASPDRLRWMRTLACRAYWTAAEGRPGAVHLNFALREPLVPDGDVEALPPGRPDRTPRVTRSSGGRLPDPHAAEELLEAVEARPRGVVVCGREEHDSSLAAAIAGFAETAGYPVLADPLSGARDAASIAAYDALLRCTQFAATNGPELVLRTGDLPASKPLRSWLAGMPDALQIAFDPHGAWHDPAGVVAWRPAIDPSTTLTEVSERLARAPDAGWQHAWRAADDAASKAIDGALADQLSEPQVARRLGALLAPDTTLFVASSMPVRDIESFVAGRDEAPRVLCNRGANGIDGTISAAFGAAATASGPVVALVGDVALAYDVGGLIAATRLGLKLTVVVLNNDGGGIFHFLPVSGETDVFEHHVATPHGLDFALAAQLYGCDHCVAGDVATFESKIESAIASPRTTIVEVRTDREANRELHGSVWSAVQVAVGG